MNNATLRQAISISDLIVLVKKEVSYRIATKNTFTAYTITKLLRQQNPGYEIYHEDVRDIVHDYMQTSILPATPSYQAVQQPWNGDVAKTYGPFAISKPAPSTPAQTVKQIAAKVGKIIQWGK